MLPKRATLVLMTNRVSVKISLLTHLISGRSYNFSGVGNRCSFFKRPGNGAIFINGQGYCFFSFVFVQISEQLKVSMHLYKQRWYRTLLPFARNRYFNILEILLLFL